MSGRTQRGRVVSLLLVYNLLRGLHILADMAWMAGLLYLPRLFVNHANVVRESEVDGVLKGMESRLYRLIMTPSMAAAWMFGLGLVLVDGSRRLGWSFLLEPWALTKGAGVLFLTGYHVFLGVHVRRFAEGRQSHGDRYWRILNELPFAAAIVMVLAVTTKCSA